jgi:hypothetical protein
MTNATVHLLLPMFADALEMLARAQYATGSKNEALATANEALLVCKDPDDRKELQDLVALYQKNFLVSHFFIYFIYFPIFLFINFIICFFKT